jgi:hypothetical protein
MAGPIPQVEPPPISPQLPGAGTTLEIVLSAASQGNSEADGEEETKWLKQVENQTKGALQNVELDDHADSFVFSLLSMGHTICSKISVGLGPEKPRRCGGLQTFVAPQR